MNTVTAATIAPDEVAIREFPLPDVGPADMLIEVQSVGVCGSDKHMYLGHANLQFPVLAGHEMVGRIVDMGEEAQTQSNIVGGPLKVGDRACVTPSTLGCGRCWYCQHVPHKPALCPNRMVYGFTSADQSPHIHGAFSRLMCIGARSNVFRVPDDLPDERAVMTEPMAVATRAVERAMGGGIPHIGEGMSIGKRVAVLGAGPIGLLTVAALRHLGAGKIIVTDMSDLRLELARRMGADLTIGLKHTHQEQRLEAVREATDGVGPDITIEAAGVPAAFEEALAMVRRGGRVVEVGHFFDGGTIALSPNTICNKEVDVLGVWAYPPMQFETAHSLLSSCVAPLEDLLSTTMPLAELESAIQLTGDEQIIKVIVDPKL